MAKMCALFVTLTAITLQCANKERTPEVPKSFYTQLSHFFSYLRNREGKEKRLFNAIDKKDMDKVQQLIYKYPLLINNSYEEKTGLTPLLSTLCNAYIKKIFDTADIALLLHNGADVNAEDDHGMWTPLTFVCAHSYYENAYDVAQLLLHHDAKVNKRIGRGNLSPLLLAVHHPHDSTKMVDLLLCNGADKTHKDIRERTPAVRAEVHKQPKIAEFITSYQNGGCTKKAR